MAISQQVALIVALVLPQLALPPGPGNARGAEYEKILRDLDSSLDIARQSLRLAEELCRIAPTPESAKQFTIQAEAIKVEVQKLEALRQQLKKIGAAEKTPRDVKPYVEFDFSPLPRDGVGTYKLQFTVLTADKDIKLSEPAQFPRKDDPESIAKVMALFLEQNRFKAEVVDKTKLRVYGRIFNDKLIPATKGMVESLDLKPEELPKVKNPEKKG